MAIRLGTFDTDNINGTNTGDLITALSGEDRIIAGAGADTIDAGDGNDVIYTATQDNWHDGVADLVLAGNGDDRVFGGYGDELNGGTGIDTLWLDLSAAPVGIELDFRPDVSLGLGVPLLEVIVGGGKISGFEAVRQLKGSAFNDTLIVTNRDATGALIDGAAGNDTISTGAGVDQLTGGAGDDFLRSGGGNDQLDGGDGMDRLLGGAGRDVMTGGAGRDLFLFRELTDSPSNRPDVVTDFSHADRDRIVLSEIDAVAGGTDDAFTFVGSAAFSGVAGELRAFTANGRTLLMGDVDGDKVADIAISLTNAEPLVVTDIVL
jgi:Ca2+-binding RTX toxin-like protein